jgi:hypothetical protein
VVIAREPFDGIGLIDRILRSRFDQVVNSMGCAASRAGDSMQGMEVIAASHTPKMLGKKHEELAGFKV